MVRCTLSILVTELRGKDLEGEPCAPLLGLIEFISSASNPLKKEIAMDTLVVDLPSIDEAKAAAYYGKKVGSGAYRNVYRVSGSRWVYKFEKDGCWAANSECNVHEMSNFRRVRKSLPEGVDFPEMHLLEDGTLAAEYVDGIHTRDLRCYSGCTRCKTEFGLADCWTKMIEPVRMSGMQDLHGGNVKVANGKVYIIDIGEYGTNKDSE